MGKDTLKILSWNAQSITKKQKELSHYMWENKIDIALIQETQLNPSNKLFFQNYNIYRNDRPTHKGGGTAILIRNHIPHKHICFNNLQNIEATSISIQFKNKELYLSSIYHSTSRIFLTSDLDILLGSDKPTLIVGDFNCKSPTWNSRVRNTNGRKLESYLNSHPLITIHSPDAPTHVHENTGTKDVLDFAISKNINFNIAIETEEVLNSDHFPVNLLLESVDWTPVYTNNRINWNLLKLKLENTNFHIPVIKNIVDLNSITENLQTYLTSTIESATIPTKPSEDRLPQNIITLIKKKNKARKLYHRTFYPPHKTELNNIQRELKNSIMEHNNAKWEKILSDLSPQDTSLWKFLKRFKSKNKQLPPISTPSGPVYTDEDKAEAFAESLAKQCRHNYNYQDDDEIARINKLTSRFLINTKINPAEISSTSPAEVLSNILSFPNKAPGHDLISPKVLKLCPESLLMILVAIFNASIRLGHFPAAWKMASVVMLPKPGKNPSFPQNYRPISLLPVLGKLLEKILYVRIQEHVAANNIIPKHQFGFQQEHNTTLQLARLTEHINQAFIFKKFALVTLLDVEKAFDSVWHNGLIYKLIKAKFPIYLIKIINSFLRCRNFRIKIRNLLSTVRTVHAGVPQGSVLSPILYNIFTHDIPTPVDTQLATYADDTAIIVSSRNLNLAYKYLQTAMDEIHEWFCKWRIKINIDKSKTITFHRTKKPNPNENIIIDAVAIPNVLEAKYLGVVFDYKLKFKPHIDTIIAKGKLAAKELYPLISNKSKLKPKNKILLYKQIVEPSLMYASPIWANASDTHIKKIQIIQNKFLRTAVNAYRYTTNDQIYRELKLSKITDKIKDSKNKLIDKMLNHNNSVINKALDYHPALNGPVKRLREIEPD